MSSTGRVAAIDCGTNSIRLLVAEPGADRRPVEVLRRTTIVRLGQGVDATGEFHPDALARTFAACDDYAALIAETGGVQQVRFVATSAARDAANSEEFFAGVEQHFGVRPDVITGAEEARLSFTGAVAGLPQAPDPVLVMDIGGGSTELIRGTGGNIEEAESLTMGAVRLRERFLHDDPPTAAQVAEACERVNHLLDHCRVPLEGIATFVGVAGTVTSMAAAELGLPVYERSKVHLSVLGVERVEDVADEWLSRSVASLREIPSMQPQRAEIISAGALILGEVMKRVRVPLTVSESDILDGIAMEMLAERQ